MSKVTSALDLSKYPDEYLEFFEQEMALAGNLLRATDDMLEVGVGTGRCIPHLAPIYWD